MQQFVTAIFYTTFIVENTWKYYIHLETFKKRLLIDIDENEAGKRSKSLVYTVKKSSMMSFRIDIMELDRNCFI